jgi:uncharacterized protein (DUF952 family)
MRTGWFWSSEVDQQKVYIHLESILIQTMINFAVHGKWYTYQAELLELLLWYPPGSSQMVPAEYK